MQENLKRLSFGLADLREIQENEKHLSQDQYHFRPLDRIFFCVSLTERRTCQKSFHI